MLSEDGNGKLPLHYCFSEKELAELAESQKKTDEKSYKK